MSVWDLRPEFRDLEYQWTEIGAVVNGVLMSDEEFAQRYCEPRGEDYRQEPERG